MSVSVNDFWNRVANSGLADSSQCRLWAVEYAKSEGSPPTSAKELAKWLIGSDHLSVFQAQNLLKGTGADLRIDSFLISEPCEEPPLSGWLRVVDTDNPDASDLVLSQLSDKQKEKFQVRWFDRHTAVSHRNLQSFRLLDDRSSLISSLPQGETAATKLESGPLDNDTISAIGVQVAGALAAMHAGSIMHGSVHPERIWLTPSGEALLLRDPTIRPPSPLVDEAAGCLDSVMSKYPFTAYAAPEFSVPGKTPDPSTDLYALGCVLYQLRFGKLPFSKSNPDQLIAAHASSIPSGLKGLQNGDDDEPLLRVIAHLMAKNREARIPSAQRLEGVFGALQSDASVGARAGASKAKRPQTAGADRRQKPATAEKAAAQKAPAQRQTVPRTPPAENAGAAEAAPRPKQESKQKPAKSKPAAPKSPTPAAAPTSEAKSKPQKPSTPPAKEKPSAEKAAQSRPESDRATEKPKPNKPAPAKAAPAKAAPAPTAAAPAKAAPPAPVAESNPVVSAAAPPVAPRDPDPAPENEAADSETPSKSAGRPGRRKKKKKKKKQAALVIGGVGFSMLMLMIAILLMINRDRDDTEPEPAPGPIAQTPNPTPTPVAPRNVGGDSEVVTSAGGKFDVADDNFLLWMPPDESDAPPLKMIPPGPSLIVVLRPSDMLTSDNGRAMLDTLKPELEPGIDAIEKRIGVALGEVERLTIGVGSTGGKVTVGYSVELNDLKPLGELRSAWGDPEPSQTQNGQTIFAGDELESDAYFVAQKNPNDSMTVKHFAVGSVKQIQLVAELGGGEIPLPRQLEGIWRHVRGDANMTVVALPNFFFADGKEMLASYAPTLVDPLRTLLIPNAAAALLTMQFDSNWYGEVRLAPGGTTSAAALNQSLKDRFGNLQSYAEDFLVGSSPHASWRVLALRLPRMLDAVAAQTRFGISDNHAVANFYQLGNAAPQVMLGTLLAINTPAGAGGEVLAVAAPSKPWTIDQMLDQQVSVSFEQEPLHFAGSTVVDEVNNVRPKGTPELKVVIIGNDLQKKGITQNQQIRNFKASNVKLREILIQLVQQANIKKGLTDPKDPEQVLVWVIAPNPESPSDQAIVITTRDGAAAAGYTLPKEFVIPE